MEIGVDFDNTIVRYDALFHRVARERNLIPNDLPVSKSDVRDYLRRVGKEDLWTELQGYVYGARMSEAAPYPGVIEFFDSCRRAGLSVKIISHKTRQPFLGERYDLHAAALNWLEEQGFFDSDKIGLARSNVFFELTKQAKLERIGTAGCSHFIDDLPEVLAEISFPEVQRILFDPNNLYGEVAEFLRVQSWTEITDTLLKIASIPSHADLLPKIQAFVAGNGFDQAASVTPLKGGRNNRVYRVASPGGDAVVKSYFQNPADRRDRFATEQIFYSFVWSQGIRRTPEPLAWSAKDRFGLFKFVEGMKLGANQVGPTAVNQALEFVLELNRRRNATAARAIPTASEACFSISEHLECIGKRVGRLGRIEPESQIDQQALSFIRDTLQPAWREIRYSISMGRGGLGVQLDWPDRVLSPSDFGFHNALLGVDGCLKFIDFEYAGWDDPAKLVCDFFCQPQVPVALAFCEAFLGGLKHELKLDGALAERALLLLPAYQIKWCCIMLNEFGRDRIRRDFAGGPVAASEGKSEQLSKARQALHAALQAAKVAN